MPAIRLLPPLTASLLVLSAAAHAQLSGGTSGSTTGTGSVSGGLSSVPSLSPSSPPTALPGTGTTGPGASSSSGSGGSAARANGTCPPGTMTDWATSVTDPNRCKPTTASTTGSSTGSSQPPSIMAPPSTSGAR